LCALAFTLLLWQNLGWVLDGGSSEFAKEYHEFLLAYVFAHQLSMQLLEALLED
jgi:hypothetical protein